MAKIKGNKKNNKLKGKGHDDKIKGLDGDDQLTDNGGNDKLIGGKGNDTLDGGIGDDTLKGGVGNDTMFGGDGDDTMDGGDGDDFMDAGTGNDFFIGGAGIDTVSFASSAFGISIEFALQTNTDDGLHDGFSGIENIDGTQFGDTIYGDGANNHLRGLGGNDYLKGGDGNDILDGGEGDDQMYSENGADQFIGGNGFDTLIYENAPSGAVINLATGVGSGSAAGDTFSGFERVFATDFADTIIGNDAASEGLFGEGGNDDIFGNGGNDTLFGGTGVDNLFGGENDDRLVPEGDVVEADHMYGGNGNDWVDYYNAGAAVNAFLHSGTSGGQAAGDTYDGIENVQGSDFDDQLSAGLNGKAFGGWGDDQIYDAGKIGEIGGTEVLRGERGDDDLYDDWLFGPEDDVRDNFVLEVGLGVDTIHGFTHDAGEPGDRIWLQEGQFNIAHNPDGTLIGGQILNATSSTATTGTQRLIFDTDAGDRILYYDSDGNGSAAPVAIGKILGLAGIVEYDFLVVPNL